MFCPYKKITPRTIRISGALIVKSLHGLVWKIMQIIFLIGLALKIKPVGYGTVVKW
jgi:hypothetical protein